MDFDFFRELRIHDPLDWNSVKLPIEKISGPSQSGDREAQAKACP